MLKLPKTTLYEVSGWLCGLTLTSSGERYFRSTLLRIIPKGPHSYKICAGISSSMSHSLHVGDISQYMLKYLIFFSLFFLVIQFQFQMSVLSSDAYNSLDAIFESSSTTTIAVTSANVTKVVCASTGTSTVKI